MFIIAPAGTYLLGEILTPFVTIAAKSMKQPFSTIELKTMALNPTKVLLPITHGPCIKAP